MWRTLNTDGSVANLHFHQSEWQGPGPTEHRYISMGYIRFMGYSGYTGKYAVYLLYGVYRALTRVLQRGIWCVLGIDGSVTTKTCILISQNGRHQGQQNRNVCVWGIASIPVKMRYMSYVIYRVLTRVLQRVHVLYIRYQWGVATKTFIFINQNGRPPSGTDKSVAKEYMV